MKNQLFVPLLVGIALLGSTNLNAMRLDDILNHDGDDRAVRGRAQAAAPAAVQRVGAAAPAAGLPAAHGVVPQAAAGARAAAAAEPVNRQAATNILKKLFMAPWELGSSITSRINSATTNVEPAGKVLMRCVLEGALCGLCLYLASSGSIGAAANRRLQLADFALEDVFSATPSHYTSSRVWIAISGLQYFIEFFGLSGLRLYAWFFGVIIGLRCAYDSLIKLPISVVSSNTEAQSSRMYPFRFGAGSN